MLFNSYEFVLLVLASFVLYYAFSFAQIPVLVLASFTFYAFNSPKLLLLLVASIAINITASYLVCHSPLKKRLWALTGVALNLLILAAFKYSPLLGDTLFPESSSVHDFLVNVPLPIGISFFTFQGISLVVDTFSDAADETTSGSLVPRDFWQHALGTTLFISFFPQLVAGPIVKARDFLPQIAPKRLSTVDWNYCFRALVKGYFLKMVVADNLREFTSFIEYPLFLDKSSIDLFARLLGYSFQIFADFAGYSLIAIGVAGLFGYRLRDNFMFPYISTSFSEFWTRWHISLSSFLKEYLYIPLGGNRKGKLRTYLNLFTTMVLGGLWHGAAWSYAVWGLYHGTALAIERFCQDRFGRVTSSWGKLLNGLLVFSCVTVGWLLFKLPDFAHVVEFVQCAITKFGQKLTIKDLRTVLLVATYSLPVVLYHAAYLLTDNDVWKSRLRSFEHLAYGGMLFLILTNSGSADEFIYFQF